MNALTKWHDFLQGVNTQSDNCTKCLHYTHPGHLTFTQYWHTDKSCCSSFSFSCPVRLFLLFDRLHSSTIYSLLSQPSSCFSWLVPPLVNNFYSLFPCHSLNDYLSAEVLRQCDPSGVQLMSRLTLRSLRLVESKWNNTVHIFVCFWLWSQGTIKLCSQRRQSKD